MKPKTTTQRKHEAIVRSYSEDQLSTKKIAEQFFMSITGVSNILRKHIAGYTTDQEQHVAAIIADIRDDMSREDVATKHGISLSVATYHAGKIGHKFPRKIVVTETTKAIQTRTFCILGRLIKTGDTLAAIGIDNDVSREYVRQLQAQCIRFDIPLHESREV